MPGFPRTGFAKRGPVLGPRSTLALALAFAFAAAACKGEPDDTPWCSAAAASTPAEAPVSKVPTWYADVKPIAAAKCQRCHVEGGIGPFPLVERASWASEASSIRRAVETRHMPPWHAARCCTDYHEDASLTDAELRTLLRWIDSGTPEGDPKDDRPAPPPVGGLSRVDLTLSLPAPYLPRPPAGKIDENRCFIVDWPLSTPKYITGFNPVPGNREVVHHLIVGEIEDDALDKGLEAQGKSDRPGFDCNEIMQYALRDVKVIGGSLIGTDYPGGLGHRMEPGKKILINVHYSLVNGPARVPDTTKIQLKLDDNAREFKGIAVANLAWLVGGGMTVRAGDPDARVFYRFKPSLYTGIRKTVSLWSAVPHMHAFGSRFVMRVVRDDDSRQCLLEIPKWYFGWEAQYWFQRPIVLEPDDEIYVECHFDNSAKNQKNGQAPRDIGWGEENQEMCAGFLAFVEGAP